jgi:GntP family gluconate:H+ symporter
MLSIPVVLVLAMILMIVALAYFRWHPMLALLLCAFFVASLTPRSSYLMSEIRDKGYRISQWSKDQISVRSTRGRPSTGSYVIYSEPDLTEPQSKSNVIPPKLDIETVSNDSSQDVWKLQITNSPNANSPNTNSTTQLPTTLDGTAAPTQWLIEETTFNTAQRNSRQSAIERISKGFGGTCERIGIMIVLASVIGSCLIASGSAQVIVRALIRAMGTQRVGLAMVTAGFILGIPVFFDTVFLLLLPVAISFYQSTRKDYLLVIMSVVVGATMAHSLVPPTPGPLLVADALHIDIGTAMLMGSLVGISTSASGWLASKYLNYIWPIVPKDETSTVSKTANEKLEKEPSLLLASLPILLPMLLLGADAVLDALPSQRESFGTLASAVSWFGQKEVALGLSTAIAVYAVARTGSTKDKMTQVVQEGLAMGATVLLVTSAGGAFGDMIRQTDISGMLADQAFLPKNGFAVLLIAFSITAVIRVLQGSATVAMITAVGLVQPWIDSGSLGFHPVYLALAIGCGSKMCPWMNDSGFWLVGRMAGLTPIQTLRSFTLVLSVMGIVGLIVTIALAYLMPLI